MKPQLYPISSFDANSEQEFLFLWEGNQSFGNRCVIRDNITNNVVYQHTQQTMQLKHTLDKNILENGRFYNISIASIDINDEISEYSTPILFCCFSKPTLTLTNITNNQVIRNSSYIITMSYSQPEGEPLASFILTLFDHSLSKIYDTGVNYDFTNGLSARIYDLEDNQTYYIQASGKTLNGLEFKTDYVKFTVNYIQPTVYSVVTLENIKTNGTIKIQSNIKAIECKTTNTPVFLNDDYVDLTNNILYIDDDFSFNGDFVIILSGVNLSEGLIMQLSDINLYMRSGKFDINNNQRKSYIELLDQSVSYRCQSNYINLIENELTYIRLTRQSGLYSVKVGDNLCL